MSQEIAFCYRTGEIGFAKKGDRLPEGVKTLVMGPALALRQAVEVTAGHGASGALMVPGLNEAYGDLEAVEAVVKFAEQVEGRL